MVLNNPLGLNNQPNFLSSLFGSFSDMWDTLIHGNTNTVNKQLGEQNLALQQDEQSWQRQFAVGEREYNRALQQTLFNREDTAIERQAEQLSKLGINPLTQQLNGLDSGSPVGSFTPSSVTPQNNFQMQGAGILPVLSALGGFTEQINQVASGSLTRDSLALENDKKMLENLVYANEHGISYYNPSRLGSNKMHDVFNGFNTDTWNSDNGIANIEKRDKKYELEGKQKRQIYDFSSDLEKTLSYFGDDSFLNSAEKILTRGTNLLDNAFENDDKKANSYLKKFFSLFF